MTVKLDCDVDNTDALLHGILTHTEAGGRVMFLCEPSRGGPALQRARVKLSRVRKARKNKGKKLKYFQLHSTIHPHTEAGKRYDAVVVWRVVNNNHSMMETLEDLVGSGEAL